MVEIVMCGCMIAWHVRGLTLTPTAMAMTYGAHVTSVIIYKADSS